MMVVIIVRPEVRKSGICLSSLLCPTVAVVDCRYGPAPAREPSVTTNIAEANKLENTAPANFMFCP
jgi:hypothetical protein